jgi:RHS repeat-associated protein
MMGTIQGGIYLRLQIKKKKYMKVRIVRRAMRTLYDGFTFEAVRESETFQYGGFTVKHSPGAALPSSTPGIVEEGRYRLVTEGYSTWLGNSPPQSRSAGEAAVPEYRYVGINATLYAKGEAIAVNRYDTDTFTGGTVYLGKDIMGSVRGISNDYGLLEDRYEYDAFGKPYKGELNSGMNLGYTSKPYDTATGLYNYGYRDYQPETARFTTVDPIRDGANWFAYVNNDPVNWVDLWGFDALTILNQDPTPGANTIINTNNEVGHSWMSITDDNGNTKTYGWGAASGDPLSGQALHGQLYTNADQASPTSSYEKTITPEQSQKIDTLWNDKVTTGLGYSYGGSAYDPKNTFCTEALVDVLNKSGVLTTVESSIINTPYAPWKQSFPSPLPNHLNPAASVLGNSTAPNPNEFENRLDRLNEQGTASPPGKKNH